MNTNKRFFALASSLILVAAACNSTSPFRSDGTVSLAGKTLTVQVARTEQEQQAGLSGFLSIDDSHGMLFPINPANSPAFWMKGMKFPIDIIWVRSGKVVNLTAMVEPEPGKPDNQLKLYYPGTEVDAVIELQAGWTARNKVKVGDSLNY
ncbi:MAG TPA: DUF192 domain-containing protein [Patescibacteria group bacterium]|jgi:hypothetical protein|nr:DUF192 domain-containing protein [Patescibacteria group bacterium]